MRGVEGENGMWYFSVYYDFINFVTAHERGDKYAQKVFSRLVAHGSEHEQETTSNYHSFKIQDSRGAEEALGAPDMAPEAPKGGITERKSSTATALTSARGT